MFDSKQGSSRASRISQQQSAVGVLKLIFLHFCLTIYQTWIFNIRCGIVYMHDKIKCVLFTQIKRSDITIVH